MVQSLIQLWRQRLDRCERRIRDGRDRAWLDAIYAQVLRFLLSRYGDQAFSVPAPRPPMPLSLDAPVHPAPPKDRGAIRRALELVRALHRPSPGRGVAADAWIVAATFAQDKRAGDACVALFANHVAHRVRQRGGAYLVEVRRAELTRAIDALEFNEISSEAVESSSGSWVSAVTVSAILVMLLGTMTFWFAASLEAGSRAK